MPGRTGAVRCGTRADTEEGGVRGGVTGGERAGRGGAGAHEGVGRQAAGRLLAVEAGLLLRYRAALTDAKSPLAADPQAWAQCAAQARRVLADCAASAAAGRVVVSEPQIAEVAGLGGERVEQGINLTHSIRAGVVLLDLVMRALDDVFPDAAASAAYRAAVRALQQGVTRRLEVGSVAYDSLLLTRVRDLHEGGRRRLAREIHDELGNALSLTLRQLEMYEQAVRRGMPDPGRYATAAKASVVEALDISRQMVTQLRRSSVSGTLETALRGFVSSLGETDCTIRIWVQGSDDWLPDRLAEELFVMVRECLRNTIRHARADNVVAGLSLAPHQAEAVVMDDGRGFEVEGVRARSNGLDGMAERVQLLGGTLDITSAPGAGTRVMIWFPVEFPAQEGDTDERSGR
jgi:signal transduction histidine kinase